MRGFQGYFVTAAFVGGVFGGLHGHQYRKKRMGDALTPAVAVAGVARDTFLGAVIAPLVIPFVGISAFVPEANRCPCSIKSNPP